MYSFLATVSRHERNWELCVYTIKESMQVMLQSHLRTAEENSTLKQCSKSNIAVRENVLECFGKRCTGTVSTYNHSDNIWA